jgi:hypothetical protein
LVLGTATDIPSSSFLVYHVYRSLGLGFGRGLAVETVAVGAADVNASKTVVTARRAQAGVRERYHGQAMPAGRLAERSLS